MTRKRKKSVWKCRRKNCGVNGQVVLFYARRQEIMATKARGKKVKAVPKKEPQAELLDALKSLGLVTTAAEVDQAVKELFGSRTSDKDSGEVIRAVFLHLKRRNSGG